MNSTEQELVKRCQETAGAEFQAAYRQLYDLYKNRVFTICLRVTGNEEDALDAAQETMITLSRRMGDFAYRSRFSSWVYRIAVNAAIDVRRRRLAGTRGQVTTFLANIEAGSALEPASSEAADPTLQAEGEEARVSVRQALRRINPKFASLLVLRYMENLSYDEIAEVLECSLGTVKSRLNRAHAALREFLEREGTQ
ncbi:MAG: RNA polymerase sigma factor [Planctomycetota bacterium]|nr:RNA polymerase sigma factor [Planctomycetota bacterium]MDP6940891.1 RNA polymerase sigma factor [Planctomycetota bacterium]